MGDASLPPAGSAPLPGLVWAYGFDADGTPSALAHDGPLPFAGPGGWAWLHVNLSDARSHAWIMELDALPEPARELLVDPDDEQLVQVRAGTVAGVLPDLARDLAGPATGAVGHLRFAASERLVLTGRRGSLQAPEAVRSGLAAGEIEATTPALLIEALVDAIADDFDRVAEDVNRRLDRIEDRVLADDFAEDRMTLGRLRLETVRTHRHLAGLRTLFHRLERGGLAALGPALRFSAARLAQRLDAIDGDIVAQQQRARLLQEEIGAKIAGDTNQHLYRLSVITALMLPPSLVAGLFGMNLKGLPFMEEDAGFWSAVILAVSSALAVSWVIRRRPG